MSGNQGPVSISRPSYPGMGIPMLKIRWLQDRLIFNMGTLYWKDDIFILRHIFILRRPPEEPLDEKA